MILSGLQSEVWVYDVESYPNFFLVGALEVNSDRRVTFEISQRKKQAVKLRKWFAVERGIDLGFNNFFYDDAMLKAVLDGCDDAGELNELSQALIGHNDRWARYRSLIDGAEYPMVADLRGLLKNDRNAENLGLKEIGVRLGHAVSQELPFDPLAPLTVGQMDAVIGYNANDLAITKLLLANQESALDARLTLVDRYQINVLSMPDAKVGEQIITALYGRQWPKRQGWSQSIASILHPNITFVDPELAALHQRLAARILRYTLKVEETTDEDGVVEISKELERDTYVDQVVFRDVAYGIGMGGLHSGDEPAVFESDENFALLDVDAVSYYPTIMEQMRLSPSHTDKPRFLAAFAKIKSDRLAAKARGDKALADGLKIAINAVYGKSGSAWSWLLDPVLGATVCINGQLILLMMIETLAAAEGVTVLSANTDGVLLKAPRGSVELQNGIDWISRHFGLTLEIKEYKRFIRRDVNNYIAVGVDGVVKSKGAYALDYSGKRNIGKKETKRIVQRAVHDHFLRDVPVETTIKACQDIAEFVDYFKVAKGWQASTSANRALPKINRWYEAASGGAQLLKVRRSDNEAIKFSGEHAVLVNDLPATFPVDVDYGYYIAEAEKLIEPIEHPDLRRADLLKLRELSPKQMTILRAAQSGPADFKRILYCDYRPAQARYRANSKGSRHDSMRAALISLWIGERGRLSRGDLEQIGAQMDLSEGYFAGKKQRDIERLARWIVETIIPFPREKLYHTDILDSSLVPSELVNEFLSDPDADAIDRAAENIYRRNAGQFDDAVIAAAIGQLINLKEIAFNSGLRP